MRGILAGVHTGSAQEPPWMGPGPKGFISGLSGIPDGIFRRLNASRRGKEPGLRSYPGVWLRLSEGGTHLSHGLPDPRLDSLIEYIRTPFAR